MKTLPRGSLLPALFLLNPPPPLLFPRDNSLPPYARSGFLGQGPYRPTGMQDTTHCPILSYNRGEGALDLLY